jgi:endonuclease/exonuclease/phosphatase family metal-dependent hydrolase
MRVAKEPPPGSPCELARALAERERIREAENAQRACLAGDLNAPSREKGLVFLAELLDRQARFADADAVITEVDRQFPQSRPLDLYRQQRPMVQKHPTAVPVTR